MTDKQYNPEMVESLLAADKAAPEATIKSIEELAAAALDKLTYKATVERVWQALGIVNYEDAAGKTIWELVSELKAKVVKDLLLLRQEAYDSGVADERERCKKLIDAMAAQDNDHDVTQAFIDAAAAIRAPKQGETDK